MTARGVIAVGQERFLIRGASTPGDLDRQYRAFVKKFRSDMPFRKWLIERGKVYVRLPGR
jgi:hypothetical protein